MSSFEIPPAKKSSPVSGGVGSGSALSARSCSSCERLRRRRSTGRRPAAARPAASGGHRSPTTSRGARAPCRCRSCPGRSGSTAIAADRAVGRHRRAARHQRPRVAEVGRLEQPEPRLGVARAVRLARAGVERRRWRRRSRATRTPSSAGRSAAATNATCVGERVVGRPHAAARGGDRHPAVARRARRIDRHRGHPARSPASRGPVSVSGSKNCDGSPGTLGVNGPSSRPRRGRRRLHDAPLPPRSTRGRAGMPLKALQRLARALVVDVGPRIGPVGDGLRRRRARAAALAPRRSRAPRPAARTPPRASRSPPWRPRAARSRRMPPSSPSAVARPCSSAAPRIPIRRALTTIATAPPASTARRPRARCATGRQRRTPPARLDNHSLTGGQPSYRDRAAQGATTPIFMKAPVRRAIPPP